MLVCPTRFADASGCGMQIVLGREIDRPSIYPPLVVAFVGTQVLHFRHLFFQPIGVACVRHWSVSRTDNEAGVRHACCRVRHACRCVQHALLILQWTQVLYFRHLFFQPIGVAGANAFQRSLYLLASWSNPKPNTLIQPLAPPLSPQPSSLLVPFLLHPLAAWPNSKHQSPNPKTITQVSGGRADSLFPFRRGDTSSINAVLPSASDPAGRVDGDRPGLDHAPLRPRRVPLLFKAMSLIATPPSPNESRNQVNCGPKKGSYSQASSSSLTSLLTSDDTREAQSFLESDQLLT